MTGRASYATSVFHIQGVNTDYHGDTIINSVLLSVARCSYGWQASYATSVFHIQGVSTNYHGDTIIEFCCPFLGVPMAGRASYATNAFRIQGVSTGRVTDHHGNVFVMLTGVASFVTKVLYTIPYVGFFIFKKQPSTLNKVEVIHVSVFFLNIL